MPYLIFLFLATTLLFAMSFRLSGRLQLLPSLCAGALAYVLFWLSSSLGFAFLGGVIPALAYLMTSWLLASIIWGKMIQLSPQKTLLAATLSGLPALALGFWLF